MKLALYSDDLIHAPVDVLALGVFADDDAFPPWAAQIDTGLDGALARSARDEDFTGKPGQVLNYNLPPGRPTRRLLLVGLGPRSDFGAEACRQYAGHAVRVAQQVGASSLAIQLVVGDAAVTDRLQSMAEGAKLGAYRFEELKTRDLRPSRLETVHLGFTADEVAGITGAALKAAIDRGEHVAAGVCLARDLVNLPANVLHPVELADRARKVARAHDLTFKALAPKDLERQHMNLHLAVAQGSPNEPRLIHLTYEPAGRTQSTPVLALVGKGLTFDAGGLSIKTSEGMMEMKIDMGGAAAVLGAMEAIARVRPNIVVHGILGAAENMPDGNAIRPGDVVKGKKGISVEILNTDAEGRLVLADALAYAQDQKPGYIVDLATLTGACMVALGRSRAAAFYDDGPLGAAFEGACAASEELFWRMPLAKELREVLKSEVADIKNIGDRWGGAITAALFLREFVDSDVPWMHLDVAGPVFAHAENGTTAKGGTGFAVRTLVELAEELARTESA